MAKNITSVGEFLSSPIFMAVVAVLVVGVCFFALIRLYWVWYKKNILRSKKADVAGRAPTLFDVRQLLISGQKEAAVKVYRKIFNVEQKEAQSAVDALEKNLRP